MGLRERAEGALDVAAMGAGAVLAKTGHSDLAAKVFPEGSWGRRASELADSSGGLGDKAEALAGVAGDPVTGAAIVGSSALRKVPLIGGWAADQVTPEESKAGEVGTLSDPGSKWGDKFEAALGLTDNEKFGKDELNGLNDAYDKAREAVGADGPSKVASVLGKVKGLGGESVLSKFEGVLEADGPGQSMGDLVAAAAPSLESSVGKALGVEKDGPDF